MIHLFLRIRLGAEAPPHFGTFIWGVFIAILSVQLEHSIGIGEADNDQHTLLFGHCRGSAIDGILPQASARIVARLNLALQVPIHIVKSVAEQPGLPVRTVLITNARQRLLQTAAIGVIKSLSVTVQK
jgi:hypothetical protein